MVILFIMGDGGLTGCALIPDTLIPLVLAVAVPMVLRCCFVIGDLRIDELLLLPLFNGGLIFVVTLFWVPGPDRSFPPFGINIISPQDS